MIIDDRNLGISTCLMAMSLRSEFNLRKSSEDTSSEDGHFGVCDESHGRVVVALDPEVDCSAELFEHGGWWSLGSRLAGLSHRCGATGQLRAKTVLGTASLRDELG